SLVGCTPRQELPPIEISYNDFVTEHHWNASVSGVRVGDTLVINLDSDPATGFAWPEIAQISDQDILKQTDHKFVSSNQTESSGNSSKDTWTFKATKKGTAMISMIYSRPEEDVANEWTFKETITVE
ncbi:MAG: protease inhibitor I42 family protein, partial [Dehalococcoidales bacterium]|nr:protease inhibitor I42 family protein [Dehalococcoidales bacterium]